MAQPFSLLRVSPRSPISLVVIQLVSTVSAGAYLPCAFVYFFLITPIDFKHPGQSWWCSNLRVGQWREPLTWLSPNNPAVGTVAGPGAAALIPALVPGTLSSEAISLPSDFSMSSTILASNLHICWDTVGCSLCSSEDGLGVPPVPRGKWTLLPHIMLPS